MEECIRLRSLLQMNASFFDLKDEKKNEKIEIRKKMMNAIWIISP